MSTAPTGTVWDLQTVRIEEIINKGIDSFLPANDPFWRDMIVSNTGVLRNDQIGRDFKILKVMMGGHAGVLEQAGPRGDFVLYGDQANTKLGAKIHLQGLVNSFPSALGSANPSPYRLGIPMRGMVSNLPVMLSELQLEAIDALIGEIVANKLSGFASMISSQLCNYTYLSQNDFYAITNIGDASATVTFEQSTGSGAYDTMVLDLSSVNVPINRLFWGDRVQIYNSAGTYAAVTTTGASIFYVVGTDELTGTIRLMAADASSLSSDGTYANTTVTFSDGTAWTTSNPDSAIIVYANSKGDANTPYSNSSGGYFTGIAGLNSWIKPGDTSGLTTTANNTLLGYECDTSNAINVNQHAEHKSLVYSLNSQPLTEHTLRRILRLFHRAKGRYGMTIDTVVASDGVWLEYEKQKIGREWIDRTGKRASLNSEGSEEGFSFSFDGKTYKGHTSFWINDGEVYGIKKGGNNWKRFSPPDPRELAGRVRQFDRLDSWVPFRFVGPAMGHNSIFFPIYSVSGGQTYLTEGLQAPGMLRMQIAPDQPAGLKLTNVTTDRLWL